MPSPAAGTSANASPERHPRRLASDARRAPWPPVPEHRRSISCACGQIAARGSSRVLHVCGTRRCSSDIVLAQILARRVAGHARFHCTHADGSSLVALDDELGELGSCDHNPEQHPPPRPASNSMPPHPEKPPLRGNFNCRQGATLIVVAQVVSLPLISKVDRTVFVPLAR